MSLFIPAHTKPEDPEDSETQYSVQEKAISEQVGQISNNLSTGATVGATVSVASGGTNAWSMLNTIQIFSFLSLLQVNTPLILKSYLKSQESYYPAYDLFHEIFDDSIKPFKKARDFKYRSSNFIINTGKPIFVLIIIIMIDLLFCILSKITSGNLKLTFGSVSRKFRYKVYLRYFIQMYIEICIPAIIQLIYVIYIQPSEDSLFEILSYNLAVLSSVRYN
jgi:hypothetical protein